MKRRRSGIRLETRGIFLPSQSLHAVSAMRSMQKCIRKNLQQSTFLNHSVARIGILFLIQLRYYSVLFDCH